jgi:GT2 family glycosyltransferase
MEVIVIDGCSEDRTLQIVRGILFKSDVRSIILSDNKGLGFARQMVVDYSKGDYIVWVDGDIILRKDYVSKQVEFMEKNPKVGIATGIHGIPPDANVIAALEDVAYIVTDYRLKGETSSRLPGTSGAIFRVKAIRKAGGFDKSLVGVGEDIDAAYRLRNDGWVVYRGLNVVFYEKRKQNLKELWDHYFWYGQGGYLVFQKNKQALALCEMTPLAGLLAGVWYAIMAYKMVYRKIVFLLPIYYTFKRLAWCFGFIKGQIGA